MKKISYSKYKIGTNYNEEKKTIQSTKEVCVPNFTQGT